MQRHNLHKRFQAEINLLLEQRGLVMHGGTITDATIMPAASSTRNSTKTRDPEMASTKKGKNYHFGMKAYLGVDAGSGAVVNTSYTAANEHDITQAKHNYRDDDHSRYGDSAFLGVEKRMKERDGDRVVNYHICKRPSQRTERHDYPFNWERHIESRKAARRWMAEYPFYIVKRISAATAPSNAASTKMPPALTWLSPARISTCSGIAYDDLRPNPGRSASLEPQKGSFKAWLPSRCDLNARFALIRPWLTK